MRLSLRYRLLLPLVLLLLGDAAATAWAAFAAAQSTEQRLAEQQWAVARTLTEPRSTFRLTERVLEQMKGFSGAEFLFVPTNGPPESTFPNPQPAPPADVPTAIQPGDDANHTLGPPVEVAGKQYRCLRLLLRAPHPNAGGNLFILYPESLRQTAVADAVRPLLILGGLGGLLAVALAVAFGSRLVRRIRDLDARTRLIAAGDFRPMPVPPANDELRDLCAAVNDMAHRLAAFQDELQRSERLRVLGQFSGGLAHQLRNAATGAKLAVELFLQENPSADPEPLQVALRQLVRIESNLRQFLDLGKPPEGTKQPCDLAQLIDQAVSLLKPQAQHAGMRLLWADREPEAIVLGDPTALAHMIGNLIGNAVEAAGPGGRVEVRLNALRTHPPAPSPKRGGGAHLSPSPPGFAGGEGCGEGGAAKSLELRPSPPTPLPNGEKGDRQSPSPGGGGVGEGFLSIEVYDSGPGPPPEVAARLFEPFVTGKPEGIGLGLAVAKQAAEAHGGSIEWEHTQGQTVFRARLPRLE